MVTEPGGFLDQVVQFFQTKAGKVDACHWAAPYESLLIGIMES
ncbi:hypothetical protein AGR2A_Cc100198 [Agrobacterium genomosp. 2 str. CFBP 5494]|uniref:Uncharacterized protein n=1 Tax=Agrobacterium genomosp. 2 str. CFBP 5494 TaxID=1183436 RepID=A0A9W5EY80_9HYPH|nr:hypothetical protein AGR2A_Cc100198 [Agrobacterium genomosp. 2 str. CFBP 5494]